MFAALLYLFCSLACFRPADHHIENESPENFQDINFEDLEQQPVGFEGKMSLTHVVPISCIYL
jgi:hypothetical protein